eukprot:SAG11_NODE_4445_length_1892_cov_1.272727_1_plen_274_part_00
MGSAIRGEARRAELPPPPSGAALMQATLQRNLKVRTESGRKATVSYSRRHRRNHREKKWARSTISSFGEGSVGMGAEQDETQKDAVEVAAEELRRALDDSGDYLAKVMAYNNDEAQPAAEPEDDEGSAGAGTNVGETAESPVVMASIGRRFAEDAAKSEVTAEATEGSPDDIVPPAAVRRHSLFSVFFQVVHLLPRFQHRSRAGTVGLPLAARTPGLSGLRFHWRQLKPCRLAWRWCRRRAPRGRATAFVGQPWQRRFFEPCEPEPRLAEPAN